MQLGGGAPSGPRPRTVAEAVTRGAAALGHRPAVSLLVPGGRQEQSGASLAQWAAKGAHLLELDLLLEPGDEVRIAAPWSWTTAAVALAVWWAGGIVRLDDPGQSDGAAQTAGAAIAVVGIQGVAHDAPDVFVVGDGIDGAPEVGLAADHEAWTRAAQPFPDQPPTPRATPDSPALRQGTREWDHRAVLALAETYGTKGTLALRSTAAPVRVESGASSDHGDAPSDHGDASSDHGDASSTADAATALALIALRPLASGSPTVILRGVDPSTAAGDRVARWVSTT